jgi:Fe-S oxidoreductase
VAEGAKIVERKPLEAFRTMAMKCVRCRMCGMTNPEKLKSHRFSDNCPSGTRFGFEAYFASGRHEIIRALLQDPPEIPVTEKLVHIAFTCTLCGNCFAICNPTKGLEPVSAIMALREFLVQKGYGPPKEQQALVKSVENYDNPWMKPRTERDRWVRKMGIPVKELPKEKAEVLYFVGCTGSFDPTYRSVSEATVKLLSLMGIDFGILGKNEVCCGSTIIRIGDTRSFDKQKKKALEVLNSLGVETIVTACAGCYSTFLHSYEGELKPRVVHIIEFIHERLKDKGLPFKKEINKKVTYHDPCHVGRYAGIYDPPREVLKAIPGVEFVEMERIREWSFCCGAGGGVRTAYPDFAQWVARKRIEEALATGAEILTSVCPFCELNLSPAAESSGGKIKVMDVEELLISSMEV